MQRFFFVMLVLLSLPTAEAALIIDGHIDEAEWQQAERFDRFVSVQPLTGTPAPHDRRAEALLLSTPDGIAVAIRAWHPATIPQTRARIPRDGRLPNDRFNFMVDFNAGNSIGSGYDFMITSSGDISDESITNQNGFSYDWDGVWQHGAADFDGGYSVEFLIPWSIASMADSSAPTRTIGVYFDRVIAATGERYAYPAASFQRPRFVGDFARVEIAQYRSSLLSVTPYAVALHDIDAGGTDFKTGADLFWKPNGDHQFALTLNPDFGQVESDQLVVNFDATETLYTDKRPFFTDNQSYFDLRHTLGQLFYTRRVGGPADDGSGAADIGVALKAIGSAGRFGYGAFAASETGDAGRVYLLLRGTQGDDTLRFGATLSRTERPWLDRDATVTALDANWKPTPEWIVRPLAMHSRIEERGSVVEGASAGVIADWDLPGPWRQQYLVLHTDADFDLNDLGYQERNDLLWLEWESGYRQDSLPATSRFASHDWEFELLHKENGDGVRLADWISTYVNSQRRDGGFQYGMLRWRLPARDDRISRGNGAVRLQGGPQLFLERERPRQGDSRWSWYASFEAYPNAVSGHSYSIGVQPRMHVGPRFDVDAGLYLWHQPDWLLWQQGREFGSFRARRAELFSNLNWFLAERQELRVKLQAIAIDAQARQARRLGSGGYLIDSAAALDDFELRNLGFQVRYRYQLDPRSDLYVVYGRGGFAIDEEQRSLGDTLADVFSLRDDHQLLVKYAYRFERRR